MRAWIGLCLMSIMLVLSGCDATGSNAVDPSQPADQRLLFIGNSFTFYNDMDQMVARILETVVPEWDDVLAVRVAPGGYTLAEHADDAQSQPGSEIARYLVTGDEALRDWDLVIFQGQSQIMGFENIVPAKQQLDESLTSLVRLARDQGATTMLYMTWGYADGDSSNPGIYSDYREMARRMADGYDDMAARLTGRGLNTYVAPVGLGHWIVYHDVLNENPRPESSATDFSFLYAGDGRHPSLAGSYLAANIIAASYSGYRVSDVQWVPNGLDPEFAAYLRRTADAAVGTSGRRFPWNS